MNGNFKDFPDWLKHYRLERKLTQQELDALAGLGRSHVAQIEGRFRAPTLATAARLARALKVSLDEMLKNFSRKSEKDLTT